MELSRASRIYAGEFFEKPCSFERFFLPETFFSETNVLDRTTQSIKGLSRLMLNMTGSRFLNSHPPSHLNDAQLCFRAEWCKYIPICVERAEGFSDQTPSRIPRLVNPQFRIQDVPSPAHEQPTAQLTNYSFSIRSIFSVSSPHLKYLSSSLLPISLYSMEAFFAPSASL